MQFYKLDEPKYESDFDLFRKNPAKMVVDYYIPSIVCPVCGPWGGLGKVYYDVCDKTSINEFKEWKRLPADEWLERRREWVMRFGVPEEAIRPGYRLGLPKGRIGTEKYSDFIFVYPGVVWITERVYLALKEHGVTGAKFYPVKMDYKGREYTKTNFYEICIESLEWQRGITESDYIICEICKGRRKNKMSESIVIDLSRWSGSDIFGIDLNPNRIFVTDRVKAIFEEYKFTNYRLIPVESA